MNKHELKPLYESPWLKVVSIDMEGILCMSEGSGENESYEELEDEYEFAGW